MRSPSKEVQREKSRGSKTGQEELHHPNPSVTRSRGGASRESENHRSEVGAKPGDRESLKPDENIERVGQEHSRLQMGMRGGLRRWFLLSQKEKSTQGRRYRGEGKA